MVTSIRLLVTFETTPRVAPATRQEVCSGGLASALAWPQDDAPVPPDLANQLTRTARHLYGRRRASALWGEVGVSLGQRPLGRQARRYASHLDHHPLAGGAQ